MVKTLFVVIIHMYVVMTTSSSSLLFSYDILVAYQNINCLVRKLKKDNIFGHEVSGHEHEKGGNFNNFYEGIMTIFYQNRFINNLNSEIVSFRKCFP